MDVPKKITVFGERLVMVVLDRDTNENAPIVLYKNLDAPEQTNKCCDLRDWLRWNTNAKRARDGFPIREAWNPETGGYENV